jgi:hypothetical protein
MMTPSFQRPFRVFRQRASGLVSAAQLALVCVSQSSGNRASVMVTGS